MTSRKLPDDLVAEMVEGGMSSVAIAEWLKVHRGTEVTPQAIRLWRKRHGYPVRASITGWEPPWDVSPEDRNTEPYRVIRLYERRRRGMALDENRRNRLEAAERFLAEGGDLVFDYKPGRKGGPWFAVPRRPGVDKGITRTPDTPKAG